MKKIVTITLGLMLTSSLVQAKEMDISIKVGERNIVGTAAMPGAGEADKPVFLMLHGFTGSRHELPVKDTKFGVFSYTANMLEQKGYPSLRIDFGGSGDSKDMKWEDTTFESQIKDATAAIDYLKSDAMFNGRKIIVLGWSQGGLVASHAVSGRDDVAATILWAPVGAPLMVYSNLLGADLVQKALKGDDETVHEATLPWGAKTSLKGKFYKQLATHAPVAALANYDGPVQIIVGTKDNVVTPSPQVGQRYERYHTAYDELHILETDHVFDAFVGPDTLNAMNKLIVKFAETQVK